MKPAIEKDKFEQLKAATSPGLVIELLGCAWGRKIGSLQDEPPCDEPAAQIIALHPGGGEREVHVKLCVHHVQVVTELTTPHEGSTDART
jgi:hypothetical protein